MLYFLSFLDYIISLICQTKWLNFEEKIYTKAIVKVSREEHLLPIGVSPLTLRFPLRFP